MRIDKAKIADAFSGQAAWMYAESHDAVRIGRWTGREPVFAEALDEDVLLTLRVFNEDRELKFSGDKGIRNTDIHQGKALITELTDKYFMVGTQYDSELKKLYEDRGASIRFPVALDPSKLRLDNGDAALLLGVKNFIRYNPVPVCPKKEDHHYGLNPSGAGAIEVIDYAYTGFFYSNGEAVKYEPIQNNT